MREIRPGAVRHGSIRNTILLLFVAIVICLWNEGFGFVALRNDTHLLAKTAILLIAIPAGFILLFNPQVLFRNSYCFFIVAIFALVLVPTFIQFVPRLGLSPIDVIRSSVFYSGLLMFVILSCSRTDSSFVAKLNALVVAISIANVLFIIALSLFPAVAGSLTHLGDRFGRVRLIASGPTIGYTFFYALVMCTKGGRVTKSTVLWIVLCGAFVWYFFTIAMGRRGMLVLPMVVCYYLVFHLDAARKTRLALGAVCLLVPLFLLVPQSHDVLKTTELAYNSVIEEYENSDTSGSVGVRLEGIRYYVNEWQESGYIGLGRCTWGVRSGSTGGPRYTSGDHGMFAVFYQFGVQGIVLTVVILFRMFRDLRFIRRRGTPQHQAIAMAIWLYLVSSIVALLQIFWNPSTCLWTGLMFFMVWRMRESIPPPTLVLAEQPGRRRFVGAEGGGASR